MKNDQQKIEFPIIQINSTTWKTPLEGMPIYKDYIDTADIQYFNRRFYRKTYIDCEGKVYNIIDRVVPEASWRFKLRFIPGMYRVKLIFEASTRTISLDELKTDLLEGIERFNPEPSRIAQRSIKEIENALSFREIITGK